MNGIDATRRIRSSLPDTKVIVLTMHAKIDFITDAFKAGATGYMTKDTTGEKLVECLKTVTRGEYYMDLAVSRVVVKNLLMAQEDRGKIGVPGYDALTLREQEIMRLIAEGRSAKQIAQKLCISQKTVENHRASIFSKLNIHSTMELVRYAAKYGLIDVDLWKE
jgi:DNA-binding NarL/FixJ family response regulator